MSEKKRPDPRREPVQRPAPRYLEEKSSDVLHPEKAKGTKKTVEDLKEE